MQVPLSQPLFDEDEQREVAAVLNSGWVMQGPKVAELEAAFRDYVGSQWAVAVSSCSTALHLAMRAIGIKPGDEVIVPSLTWIATAAAVEECGAKPVFCDTRLADFNLDPTLVETLISERTRAIVAVNLFGLAADLPALRKIAEKKGIELIEDSACSLGATIAGRQSGTFGRMGCFSFHPRKSITMGEGGMIVGDNPDDEKLLRSLRSHGVAAVPAAGKRPPFDLGDFDAIGYNYRLTDIQAAIGVAQMRKLTSILQRRREIAAIYDRALAGLEWVCTPQTASGFQHSYQSYVVMLSLPGSGVGHDDQAMAMRNRIMLQLESEGIATRPGTHAVHSLRVFREKYGYHNWSCPNAYRAMVQSIALPLFPTMTSDQIAYVIDCFRSAHKETLETCSASNMNTRACVES